MTLSEFSVMWMRDYVAVNNRPSEVGAKESRLRTHILPFLGYLALDKIGVADIERYKTAKIQEGQSPKSVNNHLAILGKCLRTAHEWELVNATPRIRPLRVPPQNARYLSMDEARLLVAACNDGSVWSDMVFCAVRTGMRRGELLGLNWSNVDFAARTINVVQNMVNGNLGAPKNNRRRFVPMTPDLVERLQRRARRSGFVFGDGNEPPKPELARAGLERAVARAGIRHIGWHALRHTFATQLVGANVPIRHVQELLGHSDIKMTMRYSHVAPESLFEAIRLLPQHLGQPVGNAQ